MNICNPSGKIKLTIHVKKGMASKAFLKYLKNEDIKNIQRQVKQGHAVIINNTHP